VPELAEILEGNGISGVPVVDVQERVVGVVSRTDLLHRCMDGPRGSGAESFFAALAQGLEGGSDIDPEELGTVEEFMSVDPVTARPDEPIAVVARRMAEERVHRVVVVDDEQHAIGMVTTLDLLKVFPA
jgi:CBS domain-containing protein